MFEQRGRHFCHLSAVVDNENRLSSRISFRFGSGALFAGDLLVCAIGQVERNRCSLSDLAVGLHRSAGLVRKTINLRQTEPGSFADLFGCEEWIEHPRQKIWRDTGARITERYRKEGASEALIADIKIYCHLVDGYCESTAVRHCVAGANGDIDYR